MSRLKKASLSLLGFTALLLAVFVIVNLGDEKLSDNVRKRLASRPSLPPGVVAGFKYQLGMFSALGDDPLTVGADIFEKIAKRKTEESIKIPETLGLEGYQKYCKKDLYCTTLDRKLHGDEISKYIKANSALLSRFDRLVEFPGASSPFPPSIYVHTQDFRLYQLAHLKALQWSELLGANQDEKFLAEWKQSNEFFKSRLRYPDTTIGVMISVSALKGNRRFMQMAMKDLPRLKPTDEILKSAEVDVPLATLENSITLTELEMMNEISQIKMRDGLFNLASEKQPLIDFAKLLNLAYRPRQMMNDLESRLAKAPQMDCVVHQDVDCDPRLFHLQPSQMIVNPVGNTLILVMSNGIIDRIRELHKTFGKLREPFDATSSDS